MELYDMDKLIMTPNFSGLPKLERFKLYDCMSRKEIHPSIRCLKRLVFLHIAKCPSFKMFPPVTRLNKLEILSFNKCPQLFYSEKEVASYKRSFTNFFVTWLTSCCSDLPGLESLEEPSLPHNNMNHHTTLCFFLKDLRKMNLSYCGLGDEETCSAVWELPNLKILDLKGNEFSRLSFNILQLPRLKWLDVSYCKDLVELSELPSTIAIVMADDYWSLGSFGVISNCKWLWNVSLRGENKLNGDILLDSVLQGNAIKYHFISVTLQHHMITNGFVGTLFRGRKLALRLPIDRYNDFCGFLICIVTKIRGLSVGIVMKEVDEDSLFEFIEAVEPCNNARMTYVGYVFFDSLRHTAFSNSSFTVISVSVDLKYGNSFDDETYVGVELVPRKSKGRQPQTTKVPTDSSEFWDKELSFISQPFTIQHDSKSSINIEWRP